MERLQTDCLGYAVVYSNWLSANLMDTDLNANVSTGMDYEVGENVPLGLKLSYVMTGNMKAQAGYINHPTSHIRH